MINVDCIRKARKCNNLSIKELGKKSNLSYKTVLRLEKEPSRDYYISTLIKICTVLDVTLDDIIK
jgi:transcriptional regulator with XRE-family HTH domain